MTEFEEDLHAPDPEVIRRVNLAVGYRRPQDTPQGMRPLETTPCEPSYASFVLVLHSPCKTKGGKPAPFPGFNDHENASRANKHGGAAMEHKWRGWVASKAREAMRRQKWAAPSRPVRLYFEWREANTRRDQDNIRWFEKVVLDGLQDAGVIENDDQRHIAGMSSHKLLIAPRDPGVTVWVQAGKE